MVVLTQEEADELISMLKKCVERELSLPSQGYRSDVDVVSVVRGHKFIISINRQNRRSGKVSFNARYRKGDVTLLRLDIGPTTPHQNPDGEIINGPHLHIYKEGCEERFAIPFDINDQNLGEICREFMLKFNVNPTPKIIYQDEI